MSKRNRQSGRRTGKNNVLPIIGKTPDGQLVVTGVYEFHETYGMPLEFLFAYLKDHNLIVDWIDFYRWGRKNNMSHDRILSKIRDPIEDSYGSECANQVCKTLTEIFNNENH